MAKAEEFRVAEVMSPEPITLTEDGTISEALGLMEREEIHEIPIVKREKLLGLLTLDEILRRGKLQPKTKVKSLMTHPPMITPDMSLTEASKILLDNGFRGSPVVGGDLLLGFISRGDILSKIPQMVDLENITAEEVMSEPVVTIMEHRPIVAAREVFKDLGIRALPVIDKTGKLTGILTQTAVVRAFAIPWVRVQRGDFSGDKVKREVEVMSLMDPPVSVGLDSPVSEIPAGGYCAVVDDNMVPVGMITPKDLLELVAHEGRKEGINVQIVGAEEDDLTIEMAYDVINRYAGKLARIFKPEAITITVDKIDKGGKPYYELTCKVLYGGKGSVNREEGWEFLPTLRELMRGQVKILGKRR
jgi:CBS domain-containing protein